MAIAGNIYVGNGAPAVAVPPDKSIYIDLATAGGGSTQAYTRLGGIWQAFTNPLGGGIVCDGIVILPACTVAKLPAATAVTQGWRGFVTDATVTLAAGIGTVPIGGGANPVPVHSTGAAWHIG